MLCVLWLSHPGDGAHDGRSGAEDSSGDDSHLQQGSSRPPGQHSADPDGQPSISVGPSGQPSTATQPSRQGPRASTHQHGTSPPDSTPTALPRPPSTSGATPQLAFPVIGGLHGSMPQHGGHGSVVITCHEEPPLPDRAAARTSQRSDDGVVHALFRAYGGGLEVDHSGLGKQLAAYAACTGFGSSSRDVLQGPSTAAVIEAWTTGSQRFAEVLRCVFCSYMVC